MKLKIYPLGAENLLLKSKNPEKQSLKRGE
jgi:hypothetical protein